MAGLEGFSHLNERRPLGWGRGRELFRNTPAAAARPVSGVPCRRHPPFPPSVLRAHTPWVSRQWIATSQPATPAMGNPPRKPAVNYALSADAFGNAGTRPSLWTSFAALVASPHPNRGWAVEKLSQSGFRYAKLIPNG